MTAPIKLSTEQINALYADFAQVACKIYNEDGSMYSSVTIVGYPDDGGPVVVSEMPRAITEVFFGLPTEQFDIGMARFHSFVNQVLTPGRGVREKLPFEPDAIVFATQAYALEKSLSETGLDIESDPRSREGLMVQVITAYGTFGGFQNIEGTPKQAVFNPKFEEVQTVVDPVPADAVKH